MKRLQVLRESREWSRAELARRANMNQNTVGLIERGRLLPYDSQLQKLATALGVGNPASLIEDVMPNVSIAQ